MNRKKLPLVLAMAILLAVGGQLRARHVTHAVTPENIDKQPFAFTVQVKDVGELKEFEITVKQTAGNPAPVSSATGAVTIVATGKKAAFPPVTRVEANGVQTYTFRVPAADLENAKFTFTETPQDARVPFPSPGDYWVFDLSAFVVGHKK